jgi:hypothetical protein
VPDQTRIGPVPNARIFVEVGEGWVESESILAITPMHRWRNEGKERYTIGTTVHFTGGTAETAEIPAVFLARWQEAIRKTAQEGTR